MKIGILTGGGDAAGLNAATAAVVRSARRAGHDVVGIEDGWAGLLDVGRIIDLDETVVRPSFREGGTLLGSSRTNPLKLTDGLDRIEATMAANGIDALVAMGGDDTLSVAASLADRGLAIVGLPKTVDFDLSVTEYCIGFDSAVQVVADSLDRLATTAASHHRVMICEVMGRHTGWLALRGGIAGGADLIIIPEYPPSAAEITAWLDQRSRIGLTASVIVVAEGAQIGDLEIESSPERDAFGHEPMAQRSIGHRLADRLTPTTGLDIRATVLGHVQRGGRPVASDRYWPTLLGVAAVDALATGQRGVCLAVVASTITPVPLVDVAHETKRVPAELLTAASRASSPDVPVTPSHPSG